MALFDFELFFLAWPFVVVPALALIAFLPRSRPVWAARIAIRVLLGALIGGLCLAGFGAVLDVPQAIANAFGGGSSTVSWFSLGMLLGIVGSLLYQAVVAINAHRNGAS